MELKNHRLIVQFSDNLYLSFRMRHAVLEALSLTALHRFCSLNYVISFGKRHLEDVLDAAHRAALEYVIRDYSASGQFSQQRAQYAGRIVYAFQKHCLILYNNPAIKKGAYGSGGFRRYFSRMIELGNNIQLLLSAVFFQTGKQIFGYTAGDLVAILMRSRCFILERTSR